MRIDRIETFIVSAPLGDGTFYSSQGAFDRRTSLLVKVATDTGIEGWGEAGVSMPVEHVASFIHDVLAPRVLGRDPSHVDPIWHDAYAFSRDFGRKGTPIDALSGIDIALWDILGKEQDRPVHSLLGGAFRERVRAYATGLYYRADLVDDLPAELEYVRAEARRYLEKGFAAIKGKIGLLSVDDDTARMEALRDVAGDDCLLMADANHAYNVHTARTVGKRLSDLGFHWFEEPVVPEDIAGCAELRRQLPIAIATGECEYTRYGFLDVLRAGAADILQADLAACGGLSEGRKILALATAHGVPMLPHVWGTGVAMSAALQFAAAIPPIPHTALPRPAENDPIFEFDCSPNPLREELAPGAFALEDGWLPIPKGPGLGIEVDPNALQRYTKDHRTAEL